MGNAAQTILVIRHAEKPGPYGTVGVAESGTEDPNELSVRGWQRAGALTQLFLAERGRHPCLRRPPDWLVAASPAGDYLSLRSISTLTPLSRLLSIRIERRFAPGEEKELAAHLDRLDGTTLVAWRHQGIPELARYLIGTASDLAPEAWPDDRYDLLWLFVRSGTNRRRFAQLHQGLLDTDAQRH